MILPEKQVYLAQTGSGRIVIPLTGEEINSICTMGSNDAAVESVCNQPSLCCWMTRYSKELIREEIRSYGDWTEDELSNDENNLQRLVWLLAWDVFDADDPDLFLADEGYAEFIQEARLSALRAALDEGEASPDVENFDPERFLQESKGLK